MSPLAQQLSPHPDAQVVIVGGGVIGASTAWHLARDPAFRGSVTVLERDPSYRLAASALSAASIRQQFSAPVNIAISLHGIRFLREIAAHLPEAGPMDLGLTEQGYLYLVTEAGAASAARLNRLQTGMGADIVLLDRPALAARFPWIDTSDLACGSWGRSGEGWFDGWGLLQAFRAAARARGAQFVTATAQRYLMTGGRITGVALTDGTVLKADIAVNACGSDAARLAATADIDLPVRSHRRNVFSFTCRGDFAGAPLMIDVSGGWCRPEGAAREGVQTFICGISPPADRDPVWDDTDPAVHDPDWSEFEDTLWPALAARVPAFEQIRPGRGWTGPYDMNLIDANAILGPAHMVPNLLLANGFSGHGLQQAPAVGRGLAEWIIHGRPVSLDLTPLGHPRLVEHRPLIEDNVI